MSNIWIMQYLCPNRHAIIGAPYDPEVTAPAVVEAMALGTLARLANPWCSICHSTELAFEHALSPYATMEAAVEAMAGSSMAQAQMGMRLRHMHQGRAN